MNRTFQLWEYWVSHSQLLIRSHRTVAHPRNIDVTFVGVSYLQLPAVLQSLELLGPTDDERGRIERILGREVRDPEPIYVLASQAQRFLIVAGAMEVAENELPLFEPRLEHF